MFWLFRSTLVSDPVLGKIASYRQWFEKRLDDAIQAADAKKSIEMQQQQQQQEQQQQNWEEKKKKNGNNGGAGKANFTKNTFVVSGLIKKTLQKGSEIRNSLKRLGCKWSGLWTGSESPTIWNPDKWPPFCEKHFEILTKTSGFWMVRFSKGWD